MARTAKKCGTPRAEDRDPTAAAPQFAVANEQNIVRAIERVLLEDYSPPGAVINERGEVLHFLGRTGKFLEAPLGAPSNKLASLARKGLRLELRALLHRARATRQEAVREDLAFKSGRESCRLNLIVRPLAELGKEAGLFIVVFQELISPTSAPAQARKQTEPVVDQRLVQQFEHPLRSTKEDLEATTIEKLETPNEAVNLANKELLPMDEELQASKEEEGKFVPTPGFTRDISVQRKDVLALRDSEQRFRTLADAGPVLLRQSGPDKLCTYFNRVWLEFTGRTLEQEMGSGWTEGVHSEDFERYLRTYAEEFDRREPFRMEYRLRRADGVYRWILDQEAPCFSADGAISGYIGGCIDITDRKEVEDALRRTEARLSAVVEHMPVLLDATDENGNITFWNNECERVTGYSAAEIVGNPEAMKLLYPDAGYREKMLRDWRAFGNDYRDWECEITCKDGAKRWVIWSNISHPIPTPQWSSWGIGFDITGRKRAEESLRRSEQIYRGIGESIDYGIWICDPEGRNIYASPSFLHLVGLTQEECSAFGWGRVLHPDDAERTIAAWQACVRTGHFWNIEHRFLGVDGHYHPILARGVPIRDDEGRVVCWAGINLDISELKQAEGALKDAQEKLSRHAVELEREVAHRTVKLQETIKSLEGVCYTIAHDLRAPLRAMQGFTTALVEDYASDLDGLGADYTRRIRAAAVKMDTLIQDLLTYGRLAHADLSMTWVGLEDLIDGYSAQFGAEIKAKNATLRVKRPLPAVWANLTVLEQIVTNLLSNALKFVDPEVPPNIQIWAEEDTVSVRLYVKDNGIGIDPRFHEKIFAIFERLHAAQEYPGTGIGLAIVRKGLERMGGKVGVESAAGKGSTFWMELPNP